MIIIYYYFEASKLPKFYANVAKIMASVNNSVFVCDDDIKRLFAMLEQQLDKDKPSGSTAYVDLYYLSGGDSGGIYVYAGKNKLDNSVLRLQFSKVRNVLEYDESAGRFSYVINPFGKGGEA